MPSKNEAAGNIFLLIEANKNIFFETGSEEVSQQLVAIKNSNIQQNGSFQFSYLIQELL